MMKTLVRRDQNWLPFFFNDFLKDDWKTDENYKIPAVNIKEDEAAYRIEVAAVGMSKKDFNISLGEENELVITAEKKNEKKEEDKEMRYLRHDFSYSKFKQAFTLPDNVNKDKIDATVEDGMLFINLPKLSEKEMLKAQRLITVN